MVLHFVGSSRDAFLALAHDLREMAKSAQKVTRCVIKPLRGGVIVVFFRQNSVSIGELLQELNWHGEVVWEYTTDRDVQRIHHDIELGSPC